ncbi:hypothetical protein HID58_089947, partial [Brassica napus]
MMHEHDNGGEDVPEEEALCRICMVELGQDSEAFNMECMCKGELALAHRECTIKWFTIKGNITCDFCKQDVKNLPQTLFRVKDPQDRSSREVEHTGISEIINEWQGLPSLVMCCSSSFAIRLHYWSSCTSDIYNNGEEEVCVDLCNHSVQFRCPFQSCLLLKNLFMGNIFCCCTRGWGSNVPQATETTTDQPRSHSQNVTNQSVSTGSRSYYSAHSSPRTESYRGGARMMDGDQDTTRRRVEEHDDGSCQDVSPAVMNGVSTEITEEISPSQHERWRDLVFDIQFRAQEDDFLTADGSFTPTPSPVSKRLTFSPMASPRIGRRVGSMSPSSANLKNAFNFKNRNNNADIEEGVALVFDGREKSNVPRTWSLTNLLTPRKSKKTESLPATPLAHSNPEICMVELGKDSEAFKMECMCKGELALAHKECTIKWFTIKGNITCDLCKQEVKNLPMTLLRVEEYPQDRSSKEAEHTEISEIINGWQGVPTLVMLLFMEMKWSAIPVALPFACIIGFLGSATSSTMAKEKYVWILATIQFSFVVLFSHVFYSRIYVKQPVSCIVLATMVGFGLTMFGTTVITMFIEWRRSHAHHQPTSTHLETKTAKTTTTSTTGKTALEMEGVSTTSTAAKWIKSSMMAATSAHLFKILSSVKSRPFIVISKNLINFTKRWMQFWKCQGSYTNLFVCSSSVLSLLYQVLHLTFEQHHDLLNSNRHGHEGEELQ